MINPPLFSVLVANYNNGAFFKDCYDSLIQQTYQDFEVVIVDDCSTDNSVQLIENLVGNDARFKIFRNEQNSGVGYTKKRCIDLAKGTLCAFVDPDDAILPNALEVMVMAHKDDTVGLVYSNFIFCDALLQQESVRKTMPVPNGDDKFFNLGGVISHFATFKRATYLLTTGLNPYYKRAIDQDLYLKLYEKGGLTYLNQDLYLYRIHDGGISTNNNGKKANFWHWQIILDTCKRRDINPENFFLETFVSKQICDNLKLKNDALQNKISLIKKSKWIKLGAKLGLIKNFDYL